MADKKRLKFRVIVIYFGVSVIYIDYMKTGLVNNQGEKKMKTLKHNEQIKVIGWIYNPKVIVGTVEGMAREDGDDVKAEVARVQENMKLFPHSGHSLAFANMSASVLEADYDGKIEAMDKKEKAYDSATVVEDGEKVEIEGRIYTVLVLCKDWCRVSDPIHFIPVK
jgi:hypothetical protein